MAKSQRVKGANGEREIVGILKAHGHDARRTAPMQTHLGARGGFADVTGLDGYHLEVKRCERLQLDAWSHQAESECGENVPVVVYRRSREPWRVSMRFEDFLSMYERAFDER